MVDPTFPSAIRWRLCTRFVPADHDVDIGNYAAGSRLLSVEYVVLKSGESRWRLLVAVPYA